MFSLEIDCFVTKWLLYEKMKDSGSRLPRSKYWTWEPTPRIKIFSLGAGSQVQNLDPGSQLPRSKSLLWEPTPKFKILILGADSQGQNLYSGSRLPSSKSLLREPASKFKIWTLGANSQKPRSQMFTPGSFVSIIQGQACDRLGNKWSEHT